MTGLKAFPDAMLVTRESLLSRAAVITCLLHFAQFFHTIHLRDV